VDGLLPANDQNIPEPCSSNLFGLSQSSVAQHSKIDPNARYHHSPERPERPGTLRFGIPVVPADAMLPKPVVPGAKLLPALANDVKRIRGAKLGICFDPEKGL